MLRAIAPLVAPQLLAFTLVFGGIQAAEAGVLGDAWRTDTDEAGVMWGDRVHTTPEELAEWLDERGRTYHVWARRHPQAAVRLERAARAQAESRESQSLLPVETGLLVFGVLALSSVLLLAVAFAGSAARVRLWPQGRLARVVWAGGMAAAIVLAVLAARLL